MRALVLILAVCPIVTSPYRAVAAPKPVAVLIAFSNDDPGIRDAFVRRKARLEACGYDVRAIEGTTLATLKTKLAQEKVPPGTVFLADGHGQMVDRHGNRFNPEGSGEIDPSWRFRFTGHSGDARLSGQDLIEAVRESATAPQLWVDACYAGGCRYCSGEGVGLGMVCNERQLSFNDARNTDHVLDLMCSGVGDCALWREADANGDGVITPRELERHLDAKLGQNRVVRNMTSTRYALLPDNEKEKADEFKRLCAADNGQLKERRLGYRYVLRMKRTVVETGRTQDVEEYVDDYLLRKELVDEPTAHFPDDKAAEAHVKPHFPRWPAECGTETLKLSDGRKFAIRFTDCSLAKKPPEAWTAYDCRLTQSVSQTSATHSSTDLRMAPVPLAHTFTLRAPRCARDPAAVRRVPGLRFRELEQKKDDPEHVR